MGSMTEGLVVPPSAICLLWHKLKDLASEAIQIAELETSGIRDGDGRWHGSNPPDAIIHELQTMCSRLDHAYRTADWDSPSSQANEDEANDIDLHRQIWARLNTRVTIAPLLLR